MIDKLTLTLILATTTFGLAYLATAIWASPDQWDRAASPFATVFSAMIALTGFAVGCAMFRRRPTQEQ